MASLSVKLFYIIKIFLKDKMPFDFHCWSNLTSGYREVSGKDGPLLYFLSIGRGLLVVPVYPGLDSLHDDGVRVAENLVKGLGLGSLCPAPLYCVLGKLRLGLQCVIINLQTCFCSL